MSETIPLDIGVIFRQILLNIILISLNIHFFLYLLRVLALGVLLPASF